MEIAAHRAYRELNYDINFWRTKTGLEVDFVLGGGEVAIEVKGSSLVHGKDMRPLKAYVEEYAPRKALIVCNERRERVYGKIRVLPWRKFLGDLWEGKIIR